jgi:hypothetical protein
MTDSVKRSAFAEIRRDGIAPKSTAAAVGGGLMHIGGHRIQCQSPMHFGCINGAVTDDRLAP